MPIASTLMVCLTLQSWYGSGKKFSGVVPTSQIATEVAAPIMRGALGEEWVRFASPLKAEFVLDRWVVTGTYKGVPKNPGDDWIVEPFMVVIDKWSSRVVYFGPPHRFNPKKDLTKIRSDRPKGRK